MDVKKFSVLNQYRDICSDVFNELTTKLNKRFKSFLMETFILYLVIPGRINFLQLGRYGKSCEQRFRQNFSKDFDWLEFNLSLSDRKLTGDRKAIAMDPSCIRVSRYLLREEQLRRSNIVRNSSLLTGFIKIMFAGKDREKPF